MQKRFGDVIKNTYFCSHKARNNVVLTSFNKILSWYFSKNALPYWCVLLVDCVIIFLSGVFTYWLFNKTLVLFDQRFSVVYTLMVYMVLSLIGAKIFSTYSGIVRFSSFDDLLKLAYANGVTLVLALISEWVFTSVGIRDLAALTSTQILVTFIISTLLMGAVRVVVKGLYEVSYTDARSLRVFIYGTMSGGVGLAKYIRTQRPRRYTLRGFISHNAQAHHMRLMGRKVWNAETDDIAAVIAQEHIDAVLVSPTRVDDFRNNQSLQDLLISAGCKIFMVQQVQEAKIEDGQLTDDFVPQNFQVNEVSVEDLLPRQEIIVDLKAVSKQLTGKRVLITGAAGSIGSEIVRQVASFNPAAMMLIDQAETPEHDIRLMMAHDFPNVKAETIVTSISRKTRMHAIFSRFRPDYVFHAAAYKHVPMMEDNPSEAVLNNIYGTKVIADCSVMYGVKKFVMISTDKAVNPTNVMGCSKRICEIYVQSLNQKLKNQAQAEGKGDGYTQFVTTRFGNVLGSNGSVIPLFREQIKNGGPVTVTDERIVRFFMLIPEACKLVLEAGTKGNGGEIFVFDMGKPVKIVDLAKRMIALSGAHNVEIKFTGLREGEKLYEEVLNELEGTKPTFHKKIRIAEVREYDFDEISKDIDELIEISKNYDNMATVKKMKAIVPEYKSNNSVYEQLDR